MLAGGRSRDCLPCPAPCLLTSFTTEPDSYLVAIYFWGGWEKIGVRLRHAGTHRKERRKNSLVIFSSSLPMSPRAPQPNPNLLSSQKRINSDWVPICHWTTHLHTRKQCHWMVPADACFLWYWYWYSLFLSPTECRRSCLQQEHDASKNETVHVSKAAIVFNPTDAIAQSLQATYQRLSEIPDPKLPVKYPRTPGYRPVGEDNPLNAW